MSICTIVTYPSKQLREKCTLVDEINEETLGLIQDLKDTCLAYRAAGLSAPQIGVTQRVFVTYSEAKFTVFINPEITNPEDPGFRMNEGCLSFPGVEEVIERFGDVSIKSLDESGDEFTLSVDGLEAVAVQHENDHLDGVLFIDHVSPLKRRFMIKKAKKNTKKSSVKKPQPSKRAKARKERKRQRLHRRSV